VINFAATNHTTQVRFRISTETFSIEKHDNNGLNLKVQCSGLG